MGFEGSTMLDLTFDELKSSRQGSGEIDTVLVCWWTCRAG
jgi:hypothetical protein